MSPFFQAARPKTLIASLSPICIGFAFIAKQNVFHPWIALFTLLTGVGIQICTNLANDLYDHLKGADTSLRQGPVRVTASGLVTVATMKKITVSSFCITALMGIFLIWQGGWTIAMLTAFALFLAYGYTAGPLPLSYTGLAEIALLIFFGPVACAATVFLQTLQWSLSAFIAGLIPGLYSCALLVVNNLRDQGEDKQTGKHTLVVRFGRTFGEVEFGLSLVLASLVPLYFYSHFPFIILATGCIFPAFFLFLELHKASSPQAYFPLLGKTSRLFLLSTLLTSLGVLI